MGIYNRDYYRDPSAGRRGGTFGLDGLSPVVKWLIVANVAVFLLQIFIVRDPSPLEMLRMHNPALEDKDEDDPAVQEQLKKITEEMSKHGRFLPRVSILQK